MALQVGTACFANYPAPSHPGVYPEPYSLSKTNIENEGVGLHPCNIGFGLKKPDTTSRHNVARVDRGVVVGLGSKGSTNNFCNGDLIRSFS